MQLILYIPPLGNKLRFLWTVVFTQTRTKCRKTPEYVFGKICVRVKRHRGLSRR
jgi:hypothetical protein